MVRIYICEDNQQHLTEIKRHVSYFMSFSKWHMQLAAASVFPEDILNQLVVDEEPNIYLFDVDLKDTSPMNGFQLGQKIRERDPNGYLIYLTSHLELSYLSFQYHVKAIDYIEKNGAGDWRTRLTNCLKAIEKQLTTDQNNREKQVIELFTFSGLTNFFVDELIAFEAIPDHKLILYSHNEKTTILQKTLDQLERELPEAFFRPHRSFLINCDRIDRIETNFSTVYMQNQLAIPVAHRKRKTLREKKGTA
ncbi:LytR/AlgR family response regulator transcription factor [Enterococcus sp. AZ007]|uniref:LytR/AlgR family response regulator transcription factor n=1 Tax=Enterococcus sp. AZ007 TaxID=2774839 RepID=UPI003F215D1B